MTKNPKSRRSLRVMKVEHKRARLQSEVFQSLIIENKATEPYAMAYDQDLLDKYRTLWQSGEWESLVTLDSDILEHHPDRAKLALIIASAWQQLNDLIVARGFIKKAKEWGCDKKLIAQILIAGVHNTLGRASVINQNESRALEHFHAAVKGGGGNEKRTGGGRVRRELARLDLLSESARLLLKVHSDTQVQTFAEPDVVNFSPTTILSADDMESPENEINLGSKLSVFYEGIVSYAQNFEDVMLWRALNNIQNGFYIDVGANHPINDSVSKAFYEKGWRGIHIEPLEEYAELIRINRPDETVLSLALSDTKKEIPFYVAENAEGLSTGDLSITNNHKQNGFIFHEIRVFTTTLSDVFSIAGSREIHWLKIDVEGMERDVLAGWGHSKARPWIVVIESTYPNTQIETFVQWEYILTDMGYQKVYYDGANRFYVSEKHTELAKFFLFGPNAFDGFALSGRGGPYCWMLNEQIEKQAQQIKSLENNLIK